MFAVITAFVCFYHAERTLHDSIGQLEAWLCCNHAAKHPNSKPN